MRKLPQSFFTRDTLLVAKELLGCYLVHESPEGKTIGKIVETEGYLCDDPACHASRGMTKRNAAMFEKGGIAYVYFTYGMYHCFNCVTGPKGLGEAVLIRAIEPVSGVDLMKKRRGRSHDIANGPAKMVIAMGLDKSHNFQSLRSNTLFISPRSEPVGDSDIHVTTRIGISQGVDHPYRFYLKGNKFISKKF